MIDIVLATYNGASFLAQQIQSIQANHDYDTLVSRFIIVDDGSTDNTQNIVANLAANDTKIEWHINSSERHGASNNFSFGLSLTSANYVMLSDQDDIWLPEKLTIYVEKIQTLIPQTLEQPLLVFSDKFIVDDRLALINNSYFNLKNVAFNWHEKFEQLCQQNVASGCTILLNRHLLNKAMPIPAKAYMHDWWLALVASRCGKVIFIEQALIKYRQHGNNIFGAKKINKWQLITHFIAHLHNFEDNFLKVRLQARAMQQLEQSEGLAENNTINALANLESYSRVKRIKLLFNKTITRSHLPGKIALLIVLLTMKDNTKS